MFRNILFTLFVQRYLILMHFNRADIHLFIARNILMQTPLYYANIIINLIYLIISTFENIFTYLHWYVHKLHLLIPQMMRNLNHLYKKYITIYFWTSKLISYPIDVFRIDSLWIPMITNKIMLHKHGIPSGEWTDK
jgi:hypothetical protein